MAAHPEHERRQSHEDQLLAFFESHPLIWIQPKHGLEQVGGRYAWRSRLTKVRKRIQGVIVWNHKNGDGTAYMYTPYVPVAPPADQPRSGQMRMWS